MSSVNLAELSRSPLYRQKFFISLLHHVSNIEYRTLFAKMGRDRWGEKERNSDSHMSGSLISNDIVPYIAERVGGTTQRATKERKHCRRGHPRNNELAQMTE